MATGAPGTDAGGTVAGRSPAFTLLGDQPNVGREDALGFDAIARDLASVIATSAGSTPFTLGIEGGWGQGKSSLMGRIERWLPEIAPDDLEVATARFNAWTAGDGDVLEGLVKAVLDQLDEGILRRVARNRQLISWARAGVSLVASVLRVGSVVDRLWDELDVDPKARNEMRDLMAESLRRWRDKGTGQGDRLLVIFVDDLDRCSPESVFQVFEAMKLYLDAAGIAFVIGFDSGIVSDAVLHEKSFSKDIKGEQYLEKVIQVRYRLPPPGDANAQTLIGACMRDSGTTGLLDEAAQTLVVERNARNPRRIKRFINSFILEYRIDQEWEDFGPEALIRVLILDFYFEGFAKLLRGRGEREPIGEVLDYVTVRDHLKGLGQSRVDWSGADRGPAVEILASYGIDPTEDELLPKEALERLEGELPEETVPNLGNAEFITLLEGFGDATERSRLWAKLQRRKVAEGPSGAEGAPPVVPEQWAPVVGGLRVLWIDDAPERNRRLIGSLRASGVELTVSAGYEAAVDALGADGVDVVISDVTRDGNSSAGFDDLHRLREGGYRGPAIFFTGRVTRSRRAEAEQLDALITNEWREVLRFLGEIGGGLRGVEFTGVQDRS